MKIRVYNRLSYVLNAKGISYTTLAKKINVSEATIYEWCNNTKQPSIKSLYKIKDVLKVNVCQLLV
jgi:transcriptional regulator with XRE-family HTH domain